MGPAQQQQTDMKMGKGRADGGIVQEHRRGFGQGTDRDGRAAMLRPCQALRCRHMVTGADTRTCQAMRSAAPQVAACGR